MVAAVLEGRLDLRDLKSRYRAFVIRVDDTYQDRYFTRKTPVSLDAEPLREGLSGPRGGLVRQALKANSEG